eukprot:m.264741 g.264741  ORF g.264741 m.264741 type:complete len:711 (+) comp28529_c0_seq1:65-2197(+)
MANEAWACSVCDKPFGTDDDNTPRFLPCFHVFCTRCIRNMEPKSCPLDRSSFAEMLHKGVECLAIAARPKLAVRPSTGGAAAASNAFRAQVGVAIDFGTSGISVAYALAPPDGQELVEKDIHILLKASDSPTGKIPTEIALTRDSSRCVAFGSSVHSYISSRPAGTDAAGDGDVNVFRFFKMALYEGSQSVQELRKRTILPDLVITSSETPAPPEPFSLETVVVRTLQWIHSECMLALNGTAERTASRVRGLGLQCRPDDIMWVITIPAIWHNGAKAFMRDCARQAGFVTLHTQDHLILALEPECASLHTYFSYRRLLFPELMAPSAAATATAAMPKKFIVVDAGAGTIDITMHTVIADQNSFQVHELYKASGNNAGGTMVDRAFREFFCDDLLAGLDVVNIASDVGIQLLRDWETLKIEHGKQRTNIARNPTRLRLSELEMEASALKTAVEAFAARSPDRGLSLVTPIARRWLLMSVELMDSFFEPSLARVCEEISAAIRVSGVKDLNCIILVGGYARCALLQDTIRRTVCPAAGCDIVIPEGLEYAVALGGIRCALQPGVIRSRKTRFTYGTRISKPFQSDIHDEARKIWDAKLQEHRVAIFWPLVKENESVDVDEIVKHPFLPMYDDQTAVSFELLVSPKRDVIYCEDESAHVARVGCITVPVNDRASGSARDCWLTMKFGATEIKVEAVSTVPGSQATARIDFALA